MFKPELYPGIVLMFLSDPLWVCREFRISCSHKATLLSSCKAFWLFLRWDVMYMLVSLVGFIQTWLERELQTYQDRGLEQMPLSRKLQIWLLQANVHPKWLWLSGFYSWNWNQACLCIYQEGGTPKNGNTGGIYIVLFNKKLVNRALTVMISCFVQK